MIKKKEWMALIDEWIDPSLRLTYDQVVELEGGYGSDFFNTVTEAIAKPHTFPGMWFASGQTDYSLYMSEQYPYSLLFGHIVVSKLTYSNLGKWLVGQRVVDVGGSIFSACTLLAKGVKHVQLTNVSESPQLDFARYVSHKLDIEDKISIIEKEDIEPGSVLICSEYLEHFEDVDAEVLSLIETKPSMLIERSSFCMVAYGHYIPIEVNGLLHTRAASAKRALVTFMRNQGWSRRKFYVFNRHPNIFERM